MDFWTVVKEYQTLVVGVPSFIILVCALWQLKHMKDARNAELFVRAFELWESKSLLNSRIAIIRESNRGNPELLHEKIKGYERNPEKYLELIRVGDFFDFLGRLVDKKLIEFQTFCIFKHN
jgi:hypothetical protein